MAWLLAYDIADPHRLLRIHRQMLDFGTPLQYSLFLVEGSPLDRDRCLAAVLPIVDRREDDLRIYALPARGMRLRFGVPILPAGISWSGMPADWWAGDLQGAW